MRLLTAVRDSGHLFLSMDVDDFRTLGEKINTELKELKNIDIYRKKI